MKLSRGLTLAALGTVLAAGAAQAQGVMAPAPITMPPSLRDAAPASGSATQPRRSRNPAADTSSKAASTAPRKKLQAPSATAPVQSSGNSYSNRVDSRPQRPSAPAFELEDDPRAVRPVLNNGRAGVGMRF